MMDFPKHKLIVFAPSLSEAARILRRAGINSPQLHCLFFTPDSSNYNLEGYLKGCGQGFGFINLYPEKTPHKAKVWMTYLEQHGADRYVIVKNVLRKKGCRYQRENIMKSLLLSNLDSLDTRPSMSIRLPLGSVCFVDESIIKRTGLSDMGRTDVFALPAESIQSFGISASQAVSNLSIWDEYVKAMNNSWHLNRIEEAIQSSQHEVSRSHREALRVQEQMSLEEEIRRGHRPEFHWRPSNHRLGHSIEAIPMQHPLEGRTISFTIPQEELPPEERDRVSGIAERMQEYLTRFLRQEPRRNR